MSKYLNAQPENFNDIFRKVLAVVLGVSAFFILVKGNIAVAGVLATAAVLSWQGSLWTYLRSKAGGTTVEQKSGPEMTRKEALEILELSGTPSSDEIKAAHHKLMKKIHPDQGGSGYFAAKLNQAKDILLNDK
ncbi:MAG: DnaJ domain-containing protein [Emcibacteraceae bacterium]|nr:DnaJ domain-containing protein [Emcibacteraceae bacterium]